MAATVGKVYVAFNGGLTAANNTSAAVAAGCAGATFQFQDQFSGEPTSFRNFDITCRIGGATNKYSGGGTPTWNMWLVGSNNNFAGDGFNILGPVNYLDLNGNTINATYAKGFNMGQMTDAYPVPAVGTPTFWSTRQLPGVPRYDPRSGLAIGQSFSSIYVELNFLNWPGGGQTCPAFVEVMAY